MATLLRVAKRPWARVAVGARTPAQQYRNGMLLAYHCPPTGGLTGCHLVQSPDHSIDGPCKCRVGLAEAAVCSGGRCPRGLRLPGDPLDLPPSPERKSSEWSSRGGGDYLSPNAGP